MIERWIDAIGYPRYKVSQIGSVYDTLTGNLIAAGPDKNGYLRVHIWSPYGERKTVSVHRLVAGSFYDIDPDEFYDSEVNHINGNKADCSVWNLEFLDRSGNMLHAFTNGLAVPVFPAQRIRCVETGMIFESTGQADRYLGVSNGSVSKTIRGIQPTCRGFTFEIIE
jgi:hypothetical protein